MDTIALVLFINNNREVLMQRKDKKTKGLFAGQWSLLEGSVVDGQLSGDLVRGIIEDNYFDPSSFSFTKIYKYHDVESKKSATFFVFKRKINVPLLKIRLSEAEQIDYVSEKELYLLNAPEIIKKIVKENM